MGDHMRALSLWEPWASAVAAGMKHVETRGWPTRWTGRLLICATKLDALSGPAFDGLPDEVRAWAVARSARGEFGHGHVVASCELVACVAADLIKWVPAGTLGNRRWSLAGGLRVDERERPWGEYRAPFGLARGRFAWLLADVSPVRHAVPAVGRQGLWRPDEALVADVQDALA